MKSFVLILSLAITTPAFATGVFSGDLSSSRHVFTTATQQEFKAVVRLIRNQVQQCYMAGGILSSFQVLDDIDYEEKTAKILYQVQGMAGNKPIFQIEMTGDTSIAIHASGKSHLKRITKQINQWLAGEQGC